jgi:hypothetical protein
MRRISRKFLAALVGVAVIGSTVMVCRAVVQQQQQQQQRPAAAPQPEPLPGPFNPPKQEPRVVTPGKQNSDPPSDAVVLFDGKDLSGWVSQRDPNSPAAWEVKDGYMQVKPGTGGIVSKYEYGDCQLHIEWATPEVVKGEGQGRGNSGVFLMGRYEVQVLDSFNNKTYFHGQAGSVYKQYAPLVNASRGPGEWQAYDIIFRKPEFDDVGRVTKRARVTVIHNGILVQDNVEIYGNTWHDRPALYVAHGPKGPLALQDHGDLVRFRNIWVRPL